jgi:hypothetical protein
VTLKLYPSSLTEMYIEWDLEGDTFSIYRSTSPASDFEIIAQDVIQPFYVDNTANLYDENIRYYYRIEGFLSGDKVAEDGPRTLEYNARDGVANKVIHESKVALRVMNNPPVYFLLKKRTGEECPECWNPVTKRVRFANCDVCNGTGILQGYHEPIPTRISQDVSQLVMASGEMDGDKVKLTPIRAWVSNTPLLHPEDIMVDVMNQRYKVFNVARRTKSQYVIRQVLDLVPLEKGHPAYQVEVDRTVLPS